MISDRALVARYFHRLGFGPKPGDFEAALKAGTSNALEKILTVDSSSRIVPPVFKKLGPRPTNAIARVEWRNAMREQEFQLTLWWMDRMVDADNPFVERMTWFWHGHWATSMSKVDYANSMLIQNQLLRETALGNFADQAKRMVVDGALQYWLDNNSNTVKAPNENLARELMELFTLGVNRYTENDIKQVAKALTGYTLDRESSVVTFNPKRHDNSTLNILGRSGTFDANSLTEFLVSRDDCQKFIAERLWFRFINDATEPTDGLIKNAFSNREILPTMKTLANHPAMKADENSMVKPPFEWFIAACRALNVLPSTLAKPVMILGFFDRLSQKPFYPPNVGGWPAGEIWLTAANAQYRIQLAQLIVAKGDITPISKIAAANRVKKLADLLGVGEWSVRTKAALVATQNDPAKLITTALCAPEYMVSV